MMVAMNLAEPSGSSPALKPPGNIRICELADFFGESGEGFLDVSGAEVAEDEDLRVGSGFAEGFGGVVFAVGAGEGGDQNLRF